MAPGLVLIIPTLSPSPSRSRFPKEESPRDTPPSQLNMGYTAPLTLQRIKGLPVV